MFIGGICGEARIMVRRHMQRTNGRNAGTYAGGGIARALIASGHRNAGRPMIAVRNWKGPAHDYSNGMADDGDGSEASRHLGIQWADHHYSMGSVLHLQFAWVHPLDATSPATGDTPPMSIFWFIFLLYLTISTIGFFVYLFRSAIWGRP